MSDAGSFDAGSFDAGSLGSVATDEGSALGSFAGSQVSHHDRERVSGEVALQRLIPGVMTWSHLDVRDQPPPRTAKRASATPRLTRFARQPLRRTTTRPSATPRSTHFARRRRQRSHTRVASELYARSPRTRSAGPCCIRSTSGAFDRASCAGRPNT